MIPSILSLVPPLVLFIVATITHNILQAFATGIFVALLIITHANPVRMMQILLQQISSYLSDSNVIMSFLFLISIGSIIALLTNICAKISKPEKRPSLIRSTRVAEYVGTFFSLLFSIDDYLSILTVGFVMMQLAERYRIARERIAYFVHALSGPLVILIPISSWAAEIVSQLYQAGVHAKITTTTVIDSNPLFLYVASMGYNFYSFLTIFSVLFFIATQKRIRSEIVPLATNGKMHNTSFPIFDIMFPLGILLMLTLVGLLYTGDFYFFGGTRLLLEALQNSTSTFFVLAISGFVAFFVGFFYQLGQKRIQLFEWWKFLLGGFDVMKGAIALIFLASIFGAFVRRDLRAGVYLAETLLVEIPISFMPLMTFLTSLLIAIITGTAWGTFALMIPIVIQMLMTAAHLSGVVTPDVIPFLLPCLGAIFSGGVCGDHLSLFSETTIMTATATNTTPIQHAKSQLFYAVFALIVTTVLFAIFGIFPQLSLYSPFVIIVIGMFLCVVLVYATEKYYRHFTR